MATETTWVPSFSGRLPGFGSTKVPGGRGLKVQYGKFTVGTSEYPTGGYAAADLESVTGFTRIEAIVPCGGWRDASGTKFYQACWDGANRKLQAGGNFDGDAAAFTAGAGVEPSSIEMGANDASLDGAILYALVIGF